MRSSLPRMDPFHQHQKSPEVCQDHHQSCCWMEKILRRQAFRSTLCHLQFVDAGLFHLSMAVGMSPHQHEGATRHTWRRTA